MFDSYKTSLKNMKYITRYIFTWYYAIHHSITTVKKILMV